MQEYGKPYKIILSIKVTYHCFYNPSINMKASFYLKGFYEGL